MWRSLRVGSLGAKEVLMDRKKESELQIAEALSAFAKSHMPITPNLVSVGIHPHCVVATLRDIVAPVEKNYAENEKSCRLLEEFYGNIFGAKKRLLEVAVENILGKLVGNSMLWVDLKSGNGVIMFTFVG
jgi:uncharacterized protein YbcI